MTASQKLKLRPKNWSNFQHYNKRTPPWVKLHRTLLDDFDYQRLPVASRALAPMLWLLASEYDNGIFDADIEYLSFRLRCPPRDIEDGLKSLINGGFFEVASGVLASCKHDANVETEGETEGENSANAECQPPTGDRPEPVPYSKIIEIYHASCPSLPRIAKLTDARKAQIRARWRNELPDLDTWAEYFKAVEMSDFLTGRVPPNGSRSKPWVADIDFLAKQGTVVKMAEGKYD